MKLFVEDQSTGEKIYLDIEADDKAELLYRLGGEEFTIDGKEFSIHEVKAENPSLKLFTGLASGAMVGTALFGALGGILGGLVGASFGVTTNEKDLLRVNKFNNSNISTFESY